MQQTLCFLAGGQRCALVINLQRAGGSGGELGMDP